MLLLGGAALAVVAGSLLFRKRESAEEKERERRLWINARGRIAEGSLVQLARRENRHLLSYQYEVAGVTYNAAQDITTIRHLTRLDAHCEGLPARVKYDPQNPPNSIVICEMWSGI